MLTREQIVRSLAAVKRERSGFWVEFDAAAKMDKPRRERQDRVSHSFRRTVKDVKAPKKSETLEVRLPYAAKTAFMARCRDDGHTASEAVRGFVERELEAGADRSRRLRLRGWQALAAALAGLAVGAAAAPSLAHTTPMSRAAFDRLDRNHDGALSFDEFHRG